MSSKQELEIDISANGDVSINVHGVKSKLCLELTKELEECLGVVTEREKKSSFYEQDTTTQIQVEGSSN